MSQDSALIKPLTFPISQKTIKNRIALAPMTNLQSHPDGSLSKDEYNWLKMRIDGDFGMIITAAAFVQNDGRAWNGQIGLHNDHSADSFGTLCREAEVNQSLSLAQLFHGGLRATAQKLNPSPSGGTNSKGETIGYAMQIDEIKGCIAAFVESAKRAQRVGFSGVEIHGAHGYLVHQFLSKQTNNRNDEWGGNFINRARFLLEIVRGIRTACGEDFLLGVRLSPEDNQWFHGIEFSEALDLAAQLAEDEKVDYLHISLWDAFKAPDHQPEGIAAITQMRNYVPANTPLITAGKIWSSKDAQKVMELGADIVALGRVAIAHPNWAKEAINSSFNPSAPPFSVDELSKAGLSEVFINYMKRWPNFVQES